MIESRNIGNAIIIVTCMYFLINESLRIWSKIAICIILLFVFFTWEYIYYPKENREIILAKIKTEEAKKLNFNAGSQLMIIQAKLMAYGLRS